jgi:predicted transcriptional regulator
MENNVVVLEPGDERAQKIAKAMSSQTASDILRLLAKNNQSLSEITDQLGVPLTTAKYHIENMLDAGLITIANTKYSVKGREVKIYSLSDQLVIVAPRQLDIRSTLLKYSSLMGVVLLVSLLVALVLPVISGTWSAIPAAAPAPNVGTMAELCDPFHFFRSTA